MLTQEVLKSKLSYNQENGEFFWIIINSNNKGNFVAGSLGNKGYIQIKIDKKLYQAHRLAWLYVYGEWPTQIDHINGIRSDNRIDNLRNVTSQQNSFNRKVRINNTSGYKGVCYRPDMKKWIVRCMVSGKDKYLGCFVDKLEAIKTYEEYAKKHHGEYFTNRKAAKALGIECK